MRHKSKTVVFIIKSTLIIQYSISRQKTKHGYEAKQLKMQHLDKETNKPEKETKLKVSSHDNGEKQSKCGDLKMYQQHRMFASYIAPVDFLKEPSIERDNIFILSIIQCVLYNVFTKIKMAQNEMLILYSAFHYMPL